MGALATARALAGSRPAEAAGRSFVAGATTATAADQGDAAFDAAFETKPGLEVSRVSQAAALTGRIEFDAEPLALAPGQKYKVAVSLLNTGQAPIEVRSLVVTTVVDGRRSSGPVTPATKVVAPGQKGPLLSVSDFLPEQARSWTMEVLVRTPRGESYRNQLAWR
jgi:hypothetical protein